MFSSLYVFLDDYALWLRPSLDLSKASPSSFRSEPGYSIDELWWERPCYGVLFFAVVFRLLLVFWMVRERVRERHLPKLFYVCIVLSFVLCISSCCFTGWASEQRRKFADPQTFLAEQKKNHEIRFLCVTLGDVKRLLRFLTPGVLVFLLTEGAVLVLRGVIGRRIRRARRKREELRLHYPRKSERSKSITVVEEEEELSSDSSEDWKLEYFLGSAANDSELLLNLEREAGSQTKET